MDIRTSSLLERLAARVRSLRKERGHTAREMAERAGLSLRFYAQLESGEANIAIGRLAAVADALGVKLQDLVAEPEPSRIVALLGLRGAGKSTIGPLLAEELASEFVELDACIEEKAGLDLREIFTLHGEAYYRRLETECLSLKIESGAPSVIALSGGVVHNAEAFALVKRHCRTIWLKALPQDHMQRVIEVGDHRPIQASDNAMADLRRLLASREPLYRQADVTVDTSAKSVPEVVDELAHTLLPARRRAPRRVKRARG
jgi:XRE family aerobic/anaerobic benzoate catabolism transcriptional regulator